MTATSKGAPKVFILGAGCSVDCDYPLANDFLKTLDTFSMSNHVVHPTTERIRRSAMNTAELLRKESYQTIDELVEAIENGVFDGSGTHQQKRQIQQSRIYEAKVATAALFLTLEPHAKKTGLGRYSEFIKEILPVAEWYTALRESDCRVLTFNYDRLFEMAFLKRYAIDTGQFPLYGVNVLNSGLNVINKEEIRIQEGRFCFLKLHGSVGMSARDEHGMPHHYQENGDPTPANSFVLNDEQFFPTDGRRNPRNMPLEPLIVFPHEKRFVRSYDNRFPFRSYIKAVWQFAEATVARASEIWIIGYRLAGMDRASVLKLLASAVNCERIVIQNPDADNLCNALIAKHPELENRLKPLKACF